MELRNRPKWTQLGGASGKDFDDWFEHFKKWLEWLLEGESTGRTQGVLYISNCEKALDGCSNDCESCMLKDLVELILTKVG